MAANDTICLIDWNSPAVECSCKPLIPLPNFDGQVQINGDNPFDALEMQINENEPFDMILNKSLNSSSEQIEFDKIVEMKNKNVNASEDLCEVFDKMNMKIEPFDVHTPPMDCHNSMNLSAISPIETDFSEIRAVRERLSAFIDKISRDSNVSQTIATQLVNTENSSNGSTNLTNSIINRGFVGNNVLNSSKEFDPMMLTGSLDEDLSAILPVWEELGFVSSSSEDEIETSPMKRVPSENIKAAKSKTDGEKIIPKVSARLPLGIKDPNIRSKKPAKITKQDGPLKAMIPIENMTKKINSRLNETPLNSSRFARKLKADSSSVKPSRRSAPIATSTPTISRDPRALNRSKLGPKRPAPPTRSCPPSPDSTSTAKSRVLNSSLQKGCSRKLALNLVSSSTNITHPSNIRKTSKDVKSVSMNSSMKSTATGIKSCVKNKENIVPFRY